MARPKPDLPPEDAARALIDGEGRILVRVTPGARSESVEIDGQALAIKTRAKPQGGAANDAVRKTLAKTLGVAPTRLELLRGATSRDKRFKLLD